MNETSSLQKIKAKTNMELVSHTISANATNQAEEKTTSWQLFVTVSALILCGSFTYSKYPPPVNVAALGLMTSLFYFSLQKQDAVSFFIQLLIGNFFPWGDKWGGNYNIAAFAAITFYAAINGKISFLRHSVLDKSIKTVLLIWCIFDLLSVTGGNAFPIAVELTNFFAFCMMLTLFYFVSKIGFTENDFYKIVFALCILLGYEFIVAFNQKYAFINSPFPFFPNTREDVEFDMGIVRSVSTLDNFEAFGEWCVSLIALLLPGILSGSFIKKNRLFYFITIVTVLLAIVCITLSGTRSSMLLLPLVLLGALVLLGKRIKAKIVILFVVGITGLFFLNQVFKIIDFSVLSERSEGTVDFEHMTLMSILNGDQMNRGGLFPYAMKQVEKTNVIGRGYFVSPEEYRLAHFEKGAVDDAIADYHNLYMSSYVMWGAIGFLCMMYLFFYSLWKGWKTYWLIRRKDHFTTDLLLGFNLLFLFLMINQFKIQFIRDITYFTLIMLMLAFYIILTWHLRKTALIKET